MDEETKEAISALLGERSAPKRRMRPSERFYSKVSAAREPWKEEIKSDIIVEAFAKISDSLLDHYSIGPMTTKPTNVPSFVPSTAHETAVLSMNTAKACVVLRAKVTSPFYDELKHQAGADKIKWNKKDEVFEINPSVLPTLKMLLKVHYKDVSVFGVQKQLPATKFDKLMAVLTKEDKSKIYRLLAAAYHPDRGGNKDTMALINEVFK